MSKRSQTKHPCLKRELNTKARRYFIETEYTNGVYDEDGNECMRPLNEEELDFLNKFYSEWLNTNFKNDGTDFYQDKADRSELYHDNYVRNYTDIFNLQMRLGSLSYGGERIDMLVKDTNYAIDPESYTIACEQVTFYNSNPYLVNKSKNLISISKKKSKYPKKTSN